MGAKLLAPAEGWWPFATNWGPFEPIGLVKLKFEVLQSPPSSPCGGLFVGLVFFVLFIMGQPQEVSLKVL